MSLPINIWNTQHCTQRQRQRGITEEQVNLTLQYGTRLHVTGALVYYLRRRDLPQWIEAEYAEKVRGTVAIVSKEGALLTTYRNSKVLRHLKKRTRWDARRPEQLPAWLAAA